MAPMKCEKCGKSIQLKKECEEEGTVYHAKCFRCSVCNRFLNENDVRIRTNTLYCPYHALLVGGFQPYCKVYFNDSRTCYRIIYGSAKEGQGEEEEGEEEE